MEIVRKINDELAIAGEVTLEQLEQVAQDGFRSVLDLRSLDKDYFIDIEIEKQYVEALKLGYIHCPIEVKAINLDVAAKILHQIDELPKPTLIHCSNAMLAAAMVLMYLAVRQGVSLQQAFTQAEQMGLFRSPSFTLGVTR